VEAVFRQQSTGKIRKISGRNTASMFQRFPVTFPHLSCRILRDTVAGIIDLGTQLKVEPSQLAALKN
jgi:hypothetical protein